jgi:integrase
MTEEKKIFAPKLHDCCGDVSKRWFVYYYAPVFGTSLRKRIKVYAGINRIKQKKLRYSYAEILIGRIIKEKPGISPALAPSDKSILLDALKKTSGFINKKTLTTYTGMVTAFLKFLKKKNDHQADKQDAVLFLNQLIQKGKSIRTVKAYRNNLSTIYNKSIELGCAVENPFHKIKLPKSSSKSLMYFTSEQITRIKNHCIENDPELWLAIELQYYCFIRPNELRQLQVKHINIAAGFIEIDSSISKNKKTQKVMIPNVMMKDLTFIEQLPYNKFIFSKNNHAPSRDALSKKHKSVLKTIGLHGRYGFYSWKHTGVVNAWKAGINIKDLQMQLRHHSLDMVNEYLKNLGVMDAERIKDLFPGI